jgi:hypothetical protein
MIMYLFLGVIIFGGIVILIRRYNEPARTARFSQEFQTAYPNTLDIGQTEIIDWDFINKLNSALPIEYMEKINTDFRIRNPKYSQRQVNEFWRELKRFLVLAAVFKKVEMFNERVDDLWHIMLGYAQDYNRFCENFIGRKINHVAHPSPSFMPDERTFFDFYYVQMFPVDSISLKIWGRFFKHGKGEEFLQEFETEPISSLKDKYMLNPTSFEAESIFESFASRFKEEKTVKKEYWHKQYQQNNDFSYGYFVYAGSDDQDHSFRDILGNDSSVDHGNHHNHSNHHHHSGGHHGHDGGSDSSSSCSSCSSCSSS